MNIIHKPLLILAALLGLMSISGAEEPDAIFRAMQGELDRSMERLEIPNMEGPYFLSYRVDDEATYSVSARCGALVESEGDDSRNLYVELRVGDLSFDNTGFVGSWQDAFDMRNDLPEENDYDGLRHQLWLITDDAYKGALESLARKQAYLQTHPVREAIPDFAPAGKAEHFDAPVQLEVDIPASEQMVQAAAGALAEFAALQDWNVEYMARALNRRFLNSEGSRHLKASRYQYLDISATTQAPDGQRLTAFLRYLVRGDDALPARDELVEAVRKLGGELSAVAAAPALEEYAGPVLFTDYAAAQMMAQLFAGELSPVRELVTVEDWMKQYFGTGKLAERLNRRVMPEFMTVTDRPDLREWKGRELAAYMPVDDEGVPGKALTLVEQGRLVDLPMGRQPAKKLRESNGHARALPNQWTQPAVTNLFVKSEQTLPDKQLVDRLRKLAREFGNEYGLLVTLLEDPQIRDQYAWATSEEDQDEVLTAPVLAYKVYEKDGRLEPVRGLVFDEASVRSLRDIAVTGRDQEIYVVAQPSVVPQFQYTISIETPSILVEEMELKSSGRQEPKPVSPRPLTERGK